jgi:hypothetical protein
VKRIQNQTNRAAPQIPDSPPSETRWNDIGGIFGEIIKEQNGQIILWTIT